MRDLPRRIAVVDGSAKGLGANGLGANGLGTNGLGANGLGAAGVRSSTGTGMKLPAVFLRRCACPGEHGVST
jgi:hypothetical protein